MACLFVYRIYAAETRAYADKSAGIHRDALVGCCSKVGAEAGKQVTRKLFSRLRLIEVQYLHSSLYIPVGKSDWRLSAGFYKLGGKRYFTSNTEEYDE